MRDAGRALLLKLYALPSLYRQRNFARVAMHENDLVLLMQRYKPKMEVLLGELGKHLAASDASSLRGLVAELEQRIQRFPGKFSENR